MFISRQTHWQFLNDELRAETETFKTKFEAKASFLLNESEEMFVGQFISFKNGEMIVRFPNTRAIPRKGDFLYCMLLPKELRDYHNWGDKTYENLYQCRYKGSECNIVWQSPSDDPLFTIIGIHRIDIDFQSVIESTSGLILVFAPQMPPTAYISNLQKVITNAKGESVSKILDVDYQPHNNEISLIKDHTTDFILRQLELTNTLILQGPPGTGKTTLIAELCAKLVEAGKSVLVTALTNRALMEIANKNNLSSLLQKGLIGKTNMSTDECHEQKQLTPLKQITPNGGTLTLSTFFISSGFAANLFTDAPFDYVIMDEASQALTAMFAATAKMGKKCLWVGDTHQLPPIVAMNDDIIREKNYRPLINGLEIMVNNSSFPVYQLTQTFRFGQRAASYTGLFYGDSLRAHAIPHITSIPTLNKILHPQGGPTLILTDMPLGETSPVYAIKLATYIVGRVVEFQKTKDIAVLTCLIKTTKALQKSIAQNVGNTAHLIIDTIARVQGLTTDITILFIPNVSYLRTIEPHLFNVATSRAKEYTIIIADKDIMSYRGMHIDVRKYLLKLLTENTLYVPSTSTSNILL